MNTSPIPPSLALGHAFLRLAQDSEGMVSQSPGPLPQLLVVIEGFRHRPQPGEKIRRPKCHKAPGT